MPVPLTSFESVLSNFDLIRRSFVRYRALNSLTIRNIYRLEILQISQKYQRSGLGSQTGHSEPKYLIRDEKTA